MKKILYILCAIFALTSCSKEELPTTGGQNPDGTYTFNLGVDEPEYVPKSRGAVTMDRYVMEMYEGDLNATPVTQTNSSGEFTVEMKKGVDYICLFWADNGTTYNVESLKAVKQIDETTLGTVAYFANVTVNSKTFDGKITLKRAVAELSFIDKNGLAEASNALKVTYPYASASFNLGDGTVTHAAGTTVRTIDNIAPPTLAADAFATDYILAPTATGKLTGLKFQLNEEAEKTIAETAIKANVKTKITGEYETPPMTSMSFTIDTRKNIENPSDATFDLPLGATLNGYSLTVDWGDGITETFDDGTALDQTNMTHTYAAAGEYKITISSSQKDPSKVHMPKLDFGNNYTSNNNPMKLLSLDTPLLNMGSNLSSCFMGCTGLTSIPAGLFEKNTEAIDFSYCFSECTGLTSIPEGLFEKNTQATNFSSCFFSCTGLTSIPEGLFEKNAETTDFSDCFFNCAGLTSIPAGLFAYNPAVTHFRGCFSGCAGLTGEIPAGLFANNTQATNFSNCFSGCAGLTSIPAGLFEKNTEAMEFSGCFFNCAGLTSIPEGLFANNTQATYFSSCFYDCTGLTSIPAGLFDNNPAVTTFSYCFFNCNVLASIPAGLFAYNTEVTNFNYCFSECAELTSIPEGLFANNTEAIDFCGCFRECTKLKLNSNIFCDEATEKTTRFAGKIMKFSYCFSNCASDASISNGDGGTAPTLWDYTMGSSSTTDCFYDVTKVTNVSNIPTKWK